MTSQTPVVTAIGMMTPVGLTAAQSCAALRAGVSAVGELNLVIQTQALDRVPVMGCAVRGVTDGYLGLGRWARLTTAALKEVVAIAGLQERDVHTIGLYLALPPQGRGVDPRIPELLPARIAQWTGLHGLERRTRIFTEGHASAALAFREALAHLAQRAVQRAIVVGVDSLVEPDSLEFFLSKRRVKTEDRLDGFIPGEAAACLLLESAADAHARGTQPLAALTGVSTAMEPVTIWSDAPSAAAGLSEAVRGVFGQLPDRGAATRLIISDLNGETYRAKEFGTAAARVLSAATRQWTLWHPADSVGDTGAAAFVLSSCVAARALARGYAKGDAVLVLGSSDDGLRGALALRRTSMEA